MANIKISELPAGTVSDDTDILAIVQSATTKKMTRANFLAGQPGTLQVIILGGGSEITTGIKCDLVVPYDCTITGVTLLADQTGSIVIDIWKDTYANFPPSNPDSITASAPPTISSADDSQDNTLTGWTTSLTAGDILRINVDSCTTITAVTLCLTVTKD